MERYEITYMYEGKTHTVYEQPSKGWENQFLQNVLDRIESITAAGGVITNVTAYRK